MLHLYLILLVICSIFFTIIEYFNLERINKTTKKDNQNNKKVGIFKIFSILIHQMLFYYILFTPLLILLSEYISKSTNKFSINFIRIYIIFMILTILSWLLFQNKCIITVLSNKISKTDESNSFRNPLDIIMNKPYEKVGNFKDGLTSRDISHYIKMLILLLIGFFVLKKRNQSLFSLK